jgi:hypothetical protein
MNNPFHFLQNQCQLQPITESCKLPKKENYMCSMTNQMLDLLKGTELFHKVQILDSLISLFNADDLVSKVILVLKTEYIQKLYENIIGIVSNSCMRNILFFISHDGILVKSTLLMKTFFVLYAYTQIQILHVHQFKKCFVHS